MKIMKKLMALALVSAMALTFASCGAGNDASKTADSDLAYVQDKGKLVVGVTDFEPMDYKDQDGNWIGFDAELAQAFAKSIGVEAEFVEIEWSNKVLELNGKSIDCVWNGMTLTDEVTSSMDCTNAYCANRQVVIVPAAEADKYQTAESCKALNFAVEEGSAGQDMATENGFNFTPVNNQATAVMEVASGTSNAAIIDSLMAGAMVGPGTGYENLVHTVALNSEEYGVGFRQGSDMKDKLNEFFEEIKANGELERIAVKYAVHESLIK